MTLSTVELQAEKDKAISDAKKNYLSKLESLQPKLKGVFAEISQLAPEFMNKGFDASGANPLTDDDLASKAYSIDDVSSYVSMLVSIGSHVQVEGMQATNDLL